MADGGNGGAAAIAGWRARLAAGLETPLVQRAVIAAICANAVTLGLETSDTAMARAGGLLEALDAAFLAFFVVELALRLAAHGARFFRDPWSVFDLAVVAIALLPATGPLSVLRALRVLRVLRLVSAIPSMRRVVAGLLAAVPGMASIAGLLFLLFYVSAVVATKLYGEDFPQWFGTLGESAYTLFQIMTLEGWSDALVRPIMEKQPWAWLFFVPFILVATFTVLNLFIAVIVNAMQDEAAQKQAPGAAELLAETRALGAETGALRAEILALRAEVAALRGVVPGGGRPAGP